MKKVNPRSSCAHHGLRPDLAVQRPAGLRPHRPRLRGASSIWLASRMARSVIPGSTSLADYIKWPLRRARVLSSPMSGGSATDNLTDLKHKDLAIINRERGSGARILLDEQLRIHSIPSKNLKRDMKTKRPTT